MLRPISRRAPALGTAVVAAAVLFACTRKKTAPSEPSGGSWLHVLPVSNEAVRPRAPPDPQSPQHKAEIEELVELRKQRTPRMEAAVWFWNAGATVRWNEIARALVAKHRTDHVMASRLYALLSVAQYDALVAAWNSKYFYGRAAPERELPALEPLVRSGDPVFPSEHAALAATSSAVLTFFYPDEAGFLKDRSTEHEESRLWAGASFRSDIAAGKSLGEDVAAIAIRRAQADGSDAVWTGTIPQGGWFSAADEKPDHPLWGRVKPWLMTSGDQFRAAPPPAPGSPRFSADLAEVRRISDTRTAEQARTAALWADGQGSYTPPGRWNRIAADLILKHGLNELRAARAFALLDMAMMDAGIACWETKYHYLVIRPPQADPSITTPIGLPNFPSYPSAHSSFSGAGSELLGDLFPDEKERLLAKAEEASLSRIFGGIHYRFDHEAGLAQGRAIAQLAIKRGRSDGSPPEPDAAGKR